MASYLSKIKGYYDSVLCNNQWGVSKRWFKCSSVGACRCGGNTQQAGQVFNIILIGL